MIELLKTREVAERLHAHINTVKRIHPLDLPFYRINKRGDRRYDVVDVAHYYERLRAIDGGLR